MEKKEIKIEEKSSMTLENRKRLFLNGVVEVVSFNEEQIMLNTNLGTLHIKGEGLKMNKLDVQNGEIMVNGIINSYVYVNKETKKEKENLFKKLFK